MERDSSQSRAATLPAAAHPEVKKATRHATVARHSLPIWIAGFFAVALAGFAALALHLWVETAAVTDEASAGGGLAREGPDNVPSLAVLPFVNARQDAEQEYFADGFTEELDAELAFSQALRLTGRTSSGFFKDRPAAPAQIAELLGVEHLLAGSAEKSGDEFEITARLFSTRDNQEPWSASYDGMAEEAFGAVGEVGDAVLATVGLAAQHRGQITRAGVTRNFEAFDALLRSKRRYALASPIDVLAEIPGDEQARHLALTIEGAERAVALDPDYGNTWLRAERELSGSIRRSRFPSVGLSASYGALLLAVGRLGAALPFLESARQLDPLSAMSSYTLAEAYLSLGRLDDAMGGIRTRTRDSRARSGVAQRRGRSAPCRQRQARSGGSPSFEQFMLDLANLVVTENLRDAEILAGMLAANAGISPLEKRLLAQSAAAAGANELAIEILRDISPAIGQNFSMRHFSDMRRSAEFGALLRELGIVGYWETIGDWSDFCRPLADGGLDCL